MRAFVINLKTRTDRYEKIKKIFADSPIQVSRIDAVKSNNPHNGLLKSFIKALRKARAMKLKNILILEDDCLPTSGWRKRWKLICKWLEDNPDKWDIYSGGNHSILFPQQVGKIDNIKFYDPLYSLASHWIYVPQRSYDKLIEHYSFILKLSPILPIISVDHLNNALKTVVSHPFMAYQRSDYSNTRKVYRNTEKMFSNAENSLGKTRRSR